MTAIACPQVFGVVDPGLPGRDVLLDDQAMRSRFAALLGLDRPVAIDDIRCVRVKYRPAESLRALHRIKVEGRWHLVASRMRASGAATLYREAQASAVDCDPLRGVAFDASLQCVFWTFPNDRRMAPPGQPLGRHPLVARLFATRRVDIEVAGYAPERAVVYRLSDALSGRTLGFAKRFAPGGSGVAGARLDTLAAANRQAAAPVRVPRLLGRDVDDELLIVEALSGGHLSQLSDDEHEPAFVALGAAMARLHALRLPPDLPFDDQCAEPAMAEAVALLALARPDVAAAAARLAERLTACRPLASAPVWIHGDLNSRNWLTWSARDGCRGEASANPAADAVGGAAGGPAPGDDVGLIDLDQSSAGPAGVDLGGVLAWMRTRTLVGAWSAAHEHQLEAALLRGYARHGRVPSPAERSWYRAAALLVQRAARAVSRVRRGQLAVLPELLAAAARDLEGVRRA